MPMPKRDRRAASVPLADTVTPADPELLGLQASAGNAAVAALIERTQAPTRAGGADDPHEREADEVARRVAAAMEIGDASGLLAAAPGTIQRKPERRRSPLDRFGRFGRFGFEAEHDQTDDDGATTATRSLAAEIGIGVQGTSSSDVFDGTTAVTTESAHDVLAGVHAAVETLKTVSPDQLHAAVTASSFAGGKAEASGRAGIERGKASASAEGSASTSLGVGSEAGASVTLNKNVWDALNVLAHARRHAGWTGELEGQLDAALGPISAQVKGHLETFVGVRASAEGSASFGLKKGLTLEGTASAFAGAKVDGEASATLAIGDAEASALVDGEAMAGAFAEAHGTFAMSLTGIAAEGRLEAFAGAKATASGATSLGWRGIPILKATGRVSATAGIGGTAAGTFTFHKGKLKISGDLGATLELGTEVGGDLEVDFGQLAKMVQDTIAEAYKDKAVEANKARREIEAVPILDQAKQAQMRQKGYDAFIKDFRAYDAKKAKQGKSGIKRQRVQEIIDKRFGRYTEEWHFEEFDEGLVRAAQEAFGPKLKEFHTQSGAIRYFVVARTDEQQDHLDEQHAKHFKAQTSALGSLVTGTATNNEDGSTTTKRTSERRAGAHAKDESESDVFDGTTRVTSAASHDVLAGAEEASEFLKTVGDKEVTLALQSAAFAGARAKATGKKGVERGKASANAEGAASTSVGVGGELGGTATFRKDIFKALDVIAHAKAQAGADLELQGQLDAALGPLKASIDGHLKAFAGIRASAEGSAKFGLISGLELEASASAFAGVAVEADARATLAISDAEATAAFEGTAMAGAKAEAQGTFTMSLAGIAAEGRAEAFAGAKATATGSASLGWRGVPILKATGRVSATAGVGGTAAGSFVFHRGRLKISGELGATLGIGTEAGGDVEVDFGQLATMIENVVTESFKDKAAEANKERRRIQAVPIIDQAKQAQTRQMGYDAYIKDFMAYNAKKDKQGQSGIKRERVQEIIDKRFSQYKEQWHFDEFDEGLVRAAHEAFGDKLEEFHTQAGAIRYFVVQRTEAQKAHLAKQYAKNAAKQPPLAALASGIGKRLGRLRF